MIRVSVMYPNGPGRKFDVKYYQEKHMVMVHRILDPFGLVRTEVDKGIGTAQPGAQAPFVTIGHLYFKNIKDMQQAMSQTGEMMPDIPNFTDAQPQIQISEIL
jgi:uncharacterized protein (TIGR02118 family)